MCRDGNRTVSPAVMDITLVQMLGGSETVVIGEEHMQKGKGGAAWIGAAWSKNVICESAGAALPAMAV